MMDVIVASKLAETRYSEMLDEAALDRRAHSADSNTNRIGLMGRIENAVAEVKLWRKNPRRTTVTSS
jgi:hypothetical protein